MISQRIFFSILKQSSTSFFSLSLHSLSNFYLTIKITGKIWQQFAPTWIKTNCELRTNINAHCHFLSELLSYESLWESFLYEIPSFSSLLLPCSPSKNITKILLKTFNFFYLVNNRKGVLNITLSVATNTLWGWEEFLVKTVCLKRDQGDRPVKK